VPPSVGTSRIVTDVVVAAGVVAEVVVARVVGVVDVVGAVVPRIEGRGASGIALSRRGHRRTPWTG